MRHVIYGYDGEYKFFLTNVDCRVVISVVAIIQAYHSDVAVSTKEAIHRSWMQNETQVVVATIAFGLGYVFVSES
jgi:hypothetical protein